MFRWCFYCLVVLRLGMGLPFLQSCNDRFWTLLPMACSTLHAPGRMDMVSVGPQFEKQAEYGRLSGSGIATRNNNRRQAGKDWPHIQVIQFTN